MADIHQLAQAGGAAAFAISHAAASGDQGVELLTQGLVYDLLGLAPAAGAAPGDVAHHFGLDAAWPYAPVEWVRLQPGAHLQAGANLPPVVRAMVALAQRLAALPGALAVVWHPARSAMAPAYFIRAVERWLAGGAFPGLGLTALVREVDGGVRSEGLRFFAGQELRVDPVSSADPAQAGKIALRLIHQLVESGAPDLPCEISGPGGEILRLSASPDGQLLHVCARG